MFGIGSTELLILSAIIIYLVFKFRPKGYTGMPKEEQPQKQASSTSYSPKIIKRLETKVAGVSMGKRQTALKKIGKAMWAGDEDGPYLDLIREPENKHDSNAIRVKTDSGQDLGYIPADVAEKLAPMIDAGNRASAILIDVLGYDGDEEPPLPYGCLIDIFVFAK